MDEMEMSVSITDIIRLLGGLYRMFLHSSIMIIIFIYVYSFDQG